MQLHTDHTDIHIYRVASIILNCAVLLEALLLFYWYFLLLILGWCCCWHFILLNLYCMYNMYYYQTHIVCVACNIASLASFALFIFFCAFFIYSEMCDMCTLYAICNMYAWFIYPFQCFVCLIVLMIYTCINRHMCVHCLYVVHDFLFILFIRLQQWWKQAMIKKMYNVIEIEKKKVACNNRDSLHFYSARHILISNMYK